MPYSIPLFRPPSKARSFILQATLGCSWNEGTTGWDFVNFSQLASL